MEPVTPERLMRIRIVGWVSVWNLALVCAVSCATADEAAPLRKAFVDGDGQGWVTLGEKDLVNVNCADDTWSFKGNEIHCTGLPIGVIRTVKPYKNVEIVVEWRHLKPAGNSGLFVWASEESLAKMAAEKDQPKGMRLPHGIEAQILDHAYRTQYEERTGNKGPHSFHTHGDVFPTGPTKMTPLPPASPNGVRGFPRKELAKGSPEWNHYYLRAINGEVRLWVNGEEVSGGTGCTPAEGYLCLESEGSPIEFRNLRVRELP